MCMFQCGLGSGVKRKPWNPIWMKPKRKRTLRRREIQGSPCFALIGRPFEKGSLLLPLHCVPWVSQPRRITGDNTLTSSSGGMGLMVPVLFFESVCWNPAHKHTYTHRTTMRSCFICTLNTSKVFRRNKTSSLYKKESHRMQLRWTTQKQLRTDKMTPRASPLKGNLKIDFTSSLHRQRNRDPQVTWLEPCHKSVGGRATTTPWESSTGARVCWPAQLCWDERRGHRPHIPKREGKPRGKMVGLLGDHRECGKVR